MSKARKHHFLPQFYLRGFSDDGKTVLQIEKHTGRSYRCSVKDAAAVRDYHKLDHPNVPDQNALENKLAEVENLFAQNLSDVLASGLPTPQQRCRLAEFIALLRVRVPAVKRLMEKHLEEAVRATGKLMDRKGKLPKRPNGLEDKLSFDQISISISNWKILEFMVRLAADPEISKILASMQPIIFRAPINGVFLSSQAINPLPYFTPK